MDTLMRHFSVWNSAKCVFRQCGLAKVNCYNYHSLLKDLIDELNRVKVQDISDFMNMDDDLRDKLMGISAAEM